MSGTPKPPAELHLPGLPEVEVSMAGLHRPLGGTGPRLRLPLGLRLLHAFSTYLPLLLMALLATSTWWLVKHTPQGAGPAAQAPLRKEPDYTMTAFSVTRFGPDGRVVLRIDGDQLRHFPDTDRMEIDGVRIHAIGEDGRITNATASRALANGDASEVQLIGAAEIISQLGQGRSLTVNSEFLHAFVRFEQLRSHLPVKVVQGRNVLRGGGLDYDHGTGRLELKAPVRAQFSPGVPD